MKQTGSDEPDRDRIWTDCAECAYKHLTAACALITDASEELHPADPNSVFAERALILYAESLTGYPGNLDLAHGCLAAIEPQTDAIRLARKALLKGTDIVTLISNVRGTQPGMGDPVTIAAAHITEAVREMPELFDSAGVYDDIPQFFCRKKPEVLRLLAVSCKNIRNLYALRGKEVVYEDPKDEPAPESEGSPAPVDREDRPVPVREYDAGHLDCQTRCEPRIRRRSPACHT